MITLAIDTSKLSTAEQNRTLADVLTTKLATLTESAMLKKPTDITPEEKLALAMAAGAQTRMRVDGSMLYIETVQRLRFTKQGMQWMVQVVEL